MWIGLIAVGVGLAVILWLGLQVKAVPFPAYEETPPDLPTVPLPDDLPAPVARFYRTIAGDAIPVITSAVIDLSGRVRFKGIPMPVRARFTHEAGRNYRHCLEAMIYQWPLLKVNEWYLDGESVLELPFGTVSGEEKVNSAANLGLWGESLWLPTIFLTDTRVRWEAIDAEHARLVVPCGDDQDSFTAHFDPETGLLDRMEAMRWREVSDTARRRWTLTTEGYERRHGLLLPNGGAVTWEDQGQPWLDVRIDQIVFNVDVSAYVRARGL